MQSRPRSRTLGGYLLLPRRPEIVVKVWFTIAGGLYFAAVTPGCSVDLNTAWRVVLAAFTLEFLGYQARYMLNDVRGAVGDSEHSIRAGTRLPLTGSPSVDAHILRVVLTSCAARLIFAVYLNYRLLGTQLGNVLAASLLLVFAIGIVYDSLREHTQDRASRSSRFVEIHSSWNVSPAAVAIYLLVGVGYPIRVISGGIVSTQGNLRPEPLVLCATACWLLGVMFVALTWVADVWHYAGDGSGRGNYGCTRAISAFPHYLPLAKQSQNLLLFSGPRGSKTALSLVPRIAESASLPDPRCRPAGGPWERVAWHRPARWANGLTVWNVSFVLSFTLAATLAASLASFGHHGSQTSFAVLAPAAATLAVVIARFDWLLLFGFFAFAALGGRLGLIHESLLLAPPLAVAVIYLMFRRMTPLGVEFDPYDFLRDWLIPSLSRSASWIVKIIIGRHALSKIRERSAAKEAHRG